MLHLENLQKTFSPGTVHARHVLRGVSLHLQDGDFASVIGSNGAGKSTLFNAVAGTFPLDSGRILLDGEDITFQKDYRRSRSIGRLFQDPLTGTAPHMTIEENLSVAYLRASEKKTGLFERAVRDLSRVSSADRRLFREKLALLDMGLEDRMDSPVGLLSGGQRQALTLLMATLVTPKLLLLDEHTAALDPTAARKILDLTEKIVCEKHITCLMITHNMQQALEMGNRTLMMDQGRILLDISGEQRRNMTVNDLLQRFTDISGQKMNNDRILLSV